MTLILPDGEVYIPGKPGEKVELTPEDWEEALGYIQELLEQKAALYHNIEVYKKQIEKLERQLKKRTDVD